jgi:ABC-type amino acid transport system permease subunit
MYSSSIKYFVTLFGQTEIQKNVHQQIKEVFFWYRTVLKLLPSKDSSVYRFVKIQNQNQKSTRTRNFETIFCCEEEVLIVLNLGGSRYLAKRIQKTQKKVPKSFSTSTKFQNVVLGKKNDRKTDNSPRLSKNKKKGLGLSEIQKKVW